MLDLLKDFDNGESLSNKKLKDLYQVLKEFSDNYNGTYGHIEIPKFEVRLIKYAARNKMNRVEDILIVRGFSVK